MKNGKLGLGILLGVSALIWKKKEKGITIVKTCYAYPDPTIEDLEGIVVEPVKGQMNNTIHIGGLHRAEFVNSRMAW